MELITNHIFFGRLFIALFIGFSLSCSSTRWSADDPDTDQMLADITYLADDKLEGRTFGSEGEVKAGDYIAKRFKGLGLIPKGDNGTWFQALTVTKASPHDAEFASTTGEKGMTGRNVIGYLDHHASYTIILGAHYDHLGYGAFGSLYSGPPSIHNGADDNASGVAMILELAQRLKDDKDFNYLFIAFTGEENGLWGSNYYCDHPVVDTSKVTAMINFDMVGRLKDKKMAVNGTGTSPSWPELLNQSNIFKLDITMGESGIGPSDHTSFYLEDIPSLHFFTGAHEDYHKPSDDVPFINSGGMDTIADMVILLLKNINEKELLVFTKTKDPDPSTTPKMEVTLGVLPDYLFSGLGMRIDGVREGKPAAIAGMMKGDIIISLAGKEIKDIYAYMEALGQFHKGDKTKLIALRDGKEQEFEIQF